MSVVVRGAEYCLSSRAVWLPSQRLSMYPCDDSNLMLWRVVESGQRAADGQPLYLLRSHRFPFFKLRVQERCAGAGQAIACELALGSDIPGEAGADEGCDAPDAPLELWRLANLPTSAVSNKSGPPPNSSEVHITLRFGLLAMGVCLLAATILIGALLVWRRKRRRRDAPGAQPQDGAGDADRDAQDPADAAQPAPAAAPPLEMDTAAVP